MKKILLAIFVAIFVCASIEAQETLSPYFKVAELETTISAASQQVKDAIKANGYEVIGEYNPGA